MLYYSTANPRHRVGLMEAVSRGLPPGGGYYMPERIPYIPPAFFNNMADMSLKDIGYVVANTLFGEDIPSAALKKIVADAINFDTPVVADPDHHGMYALELFHGPSRSYKDFGARFMAHTMRFFHDSHEPLNIVVATTGDAGEAVARSFFGMPSTNVFIVYPRSGTGIRQLASFASLGGNIIPVEVRGSFAQCHDMVRSLFADPSVGSSINIFAANSFNLARLLPQTIYYFYAYAQLLRAGADLSNLVITLPAGNLGNLTAGLIAKRMGLPARRIISVRSGSPDIFHNYLHHHLRPSRTDDPVIPPNFWRLMALYDNDSERLAADSGSVICPLPGLPDGAPGPEAARMALTDPAIEATTRLYLATTGSRPAEPPHAHHTLRPAATLPPSPTLFRDLMLRTRRGHGGAPAHY